jgi:hypothetical protein
MFKASQQVNDRKEEILEIVSVQIINNVEVNNSLSLSLLQRMVSSNPSGSEINEIINVKQ